MTNNEKFNRMLNQCKHPRLVYNALAGGTPNIQKLARTKKAPLPAGTGKRAVPAW